MTKFIVVFCGVEVWRNVRDDGSGADCERVFEHKASEAEAEFESFVGGEKVVEEEGGTEEGGTEVCACVWCI